MKLRNKITGRIEDVYTQQHDKGFYVGYDVDGCHVNAYYRTLSAFMDAWEDFDETKDFWFLDTEFGEIRGMRNESYEEYQSWGIWLEELGLKFESKESGDKVVEKLKALKRLKDNELEFVKWIGRKIDDGYIPLVVAGTLKCGKNEDDWKLIKRDLELLFGGEI